MRHQNLFQNELRLLITARKRRSHIQVTLQNIAYRNPFTDDVAGEHRLRDRRNGENHLRVSGLVSRQIQGRHNFLYLPKRYLFDTGILRHLREVAVPSIRILGTLAPMARQPLGGMGQALTVIGLPSVPHRIENKKAANLSAAAF
jgi:hypothetical protein